VDTLRFLQDAPERSANAEALLRRYKGALFQIAEDGGAELRRVKQELEVELRRVIVRTERLGASADRNGMLKEYPADGLHLQSRDALAYREAQRLARQVDHPDLMEYWKGAPYLLSFARGYALTEAIRDGRELGDGRRDAINASIERERHLHVPREVRRGDAPVDPPHSRMRWLLDDVSRQGLWDLCWLPPSLPYHALGGRFAAVGANTTKRLIFSSWRMVPRAVAVLVSLEAERRMFEGKRRVPLPDAPEKVSPPLVFTLRSGEASRMSTMSLVYPSFTLSELGDPLSIARQHGTALDIDSVLAKVGEALAPRLALLTASAPTDGREDDRWYWAAPILLDLATDAADTNSWVDRIFLHQYWVGEDPVEASQVAETIGRERGWQAHVRMVRNVAAGRFEPLGKPPADLGEVMALLAVAGPANCALRAICRGMTGETLRGVATRDAAATVAYELRTLFNIAEVVAMLRGRVEDDEAYWRVSFAILRRRRAAVSAGRVGARPARIGGTCGG
jgi:hypothetical protein